MNLQLYRNIFKYENNFTEDLMLIKPKKDSALNKTDKCY